MGGTKQKKMNPLPIKDCPITPSLQYFTAIHLDPVDVCSLVEIDARNFAISWKVYVWLSLYDNDRIE